MFKRNSELMAHFEQINKSQLWKKNWRNGFFSPDEATSPQTTLVSGAWSLPGFYLLHKKDQRLSTAKLRGAAALPLSNCADCRARFSQLFFFLQGGAALNNPAKTRQPEGAPVSSGP